MKKILFSGFHALRKTLLKVASIPMLRDSATGLQTSLPAERQETSPLYSLPIILLDNRFSFG